jgi:hypothetical protein
MTLLAKGGRCAKCFGDRPKRSTDVIAFEYDGTRYEMPLCDEHSRLASLDFGGWIRVATVVEAFPAVVTTTAPPRHEVPAVPRRTVGRAPVEPWPVIRRSEPVRREPAPAADRTADTPSRDVVVKGVRHRLTMHAVIRMTQRGIDRNDVHDTLGAFDRTVTTCGSRHANGARKVQRGDIVVVVGKDNEIITVARPDEREELRAYAN